VFDLSNVLLQFVDVGEVGLTLLSIGGGRAASEELGHGVKDESDNIVGGVTLDVVLDGGKVLLVDAFHFLGLRFEQLSLDLHQVVKDGLILLCF